MAPVAQKMKMFDARTGRGASPSLRRRRRAFNATAAFRAFTNGDEAGARAYIAFALNNGARLADLGRAGRQVAQSEEQRDAWLALLRQSPMYSLRARLIQISRIAGEKYGTPAFSEEAVSVLVGDAEPAVLASEAAIEQGLALGTSTTTASYTSAYGALTYSSILYPSAKAKHKRSDADLRKVAARTSEKTSKFIYDEGSTPVYLKQPYLTGSDWREIAASSAKCLFPAKVDEKKRPLPPEDAQWGTAEFDVWVEGLCYEDGKEKALMAEAEGLALREQQFAGVNSFVAKTIEIMRETQRQQELNLDAAFKGLPLPYNAPPKNAPGVTSLYVLPVNYAVPGLPVNPASWQGSHATKGPPAPPGAIAGQIYTPPPVAAAVPPQQVVDPVTGQVTIVAAPAGTPSTAYPGGPVTPTYPTQPGQTYPGYTPPPPPPPEESLEPKKKKKKKSSMTLPLVLGVGALGVGALVVIRSRR